MLRFDIHPTPDDCPPLDYSRYYDIETPWGIYRLSKDANPVAQAAAGHALHARWSHDAVLTTYRLVDSACYLLPLLLVLSVAGAMLWRWRRRRA